MLSQTVRFHSFYGQVIFHSTYVPHLLCRSSMDGHLGCFHILATVSKAAVNIGAHTSRQIGVRFNLCLLNENRVAKEKRGKAGRG